MTDNEQKLATALNDLYWFVKEVLDDNPDLEVPSTFDGNSDVMGRARLALISGFSENFKNP